VISGAAVGFGFTDDVVWLHCFLSNPSDAPLARLLSMPGTIDSLDLYVRNGSSWEVQHTGKKVGYDARPIRAHELALPLVLRPHTTEELWLRASGRDSLELHPLIWTAEAFDRENVRQSLAAAAYFGALGTMALFNLFIWILLRDRAYLYYGLFQLAAMLMLGAADGRTFRYLWPNSPEWAARSEMIFTFLALLTGVMFTRNFLGPGYFKGLGERIFRGFVTLYLLGLVGALLTDHRLMQSATVAAIALNCAAALTAGIVATSLGSPNGPIFTAAFTILLISGILSAGAYLGTWDAPFLEVEVPRLGSVAEAVLLSFGLARRIKLAQRDKEAVQGQLVAQERAHAHLLERRVQERTKELQDALEQLRDAQARMVIQARLASLGHLIAGVAHEVGNPLNFVIGGSSEVRKRLRVLKTTLSSLVPSDSPTTRTLDGALEAAELVRDGSDRIHRLIENLRAYTGVRGRARQPLDVRETLESTLLLIEPLTTQQRVRVVRDFAATVPLVRSPPGELGQVFLNLMLNSCQAMPDGGTLTLVVRATEERIDVVVQDTGQGVPAEHREAIFDPFFTTRLSEGTGLGLSLSARIVADHGGELRLLSEAPGASFQVSLPCQESLAQSQDGRGI